MKIHYLIQGQGSPVVLIHGLHASARLNWQMPGILSFLGKDYQVIALDMPGHGESDRPENQKSYGLQMVEDVIGLMDTLEIKKAHFVGYSMGGMVLVKLMTTHQDRVISGIVGGMGWVQEGSRLQEVWEVLPTREGSLIPAACIRGLGKLAVTRQDLQRIQVPVLILVGDQDPVKQLYVEPLEQVRNDWPVIEIKEARHLNCIVKLQFKEAIKTWLDKQTGLTP